MAFQVRLTIVFGIIACLLSMALATPGTATFYAGHVPSTCFGSKDYGVMIAAVNDNLWQNGGICGKVFNVTCTGPTNPSVPPPCTGKSVMVKIVEHCPGCGGTIDLSREAFAAIANPVAGIIKIEYNQIS